MESILKNSIYIFCAVILSACSGSKSLNQVNLAENYTPDQKELFFDATLINQNDSISCIEFEFKTDQLLFSKNTEDKFISRYSVDYKVYTNYNDNSIIDSSQIHYSITKTSKTPQLKKHKIKTFAPRGSDYLIQITFTDENRNQKKTTFTSLKKTNLTAANYFKIISPDGGQSGYYQKDSFQIIPQSDSIQYIKVLTFNRKHYIAPKPHDLSYNFRFLGDPDTSWLISLSVKNKIDLPAIENGFYHFITDTLSKKGFSVFHTPKDYPQVNNLNEAIGSMGYLLNPKEYARLITSSTPRASFDLEWKKISGGKERARNLIREYYKSVSKANQMFTSYKPGWSTDRGMIYIIYGPPKIVYRYDDSEVWIYGEENNLLSDVFKFEKIESSIADNIYILERNINYKVNWNRMVTSWKEDRGF